MKSTAKLIITYLEYLEIEKGRSPLTIRNYDAYLRRFLKWFQINNPNKSKSKKTTPNFPPQDITIDLVRKFRVYLSRQKNNRGEYLSQATQNYYVIALRNFLKFLQKQDIPSLAPEKIELGKHPRAQIQILSLEKLDVMLRSPDLSCLSGLRDRAILETFFSTGLRVSELTKLNCENINLLTREFMIRGKGAKDRLVFLSPKAAEHIKNYLNKREDNYSPLFIRLKGTPPTEDKQGLAMRLTTRSIERIIKKHAKRAGIVTKVTPHTLRHTFATDLLSNGADLRSVQELLGHSNIQTTQVYTHVSNRQLKEVHQAFHGKRRKINSS